MKIYLTRTCKTLVPSGITLLGLFALSVMLAMTGCQGNVGPNMAASQSAAQAEKPTEVSVSQQNLQATPADSTSGQSISMAPTIPEANPGAISEPSDILILTLPTPIPEPVSLWRPPLYKAPWALSNHDHFYFSRPIAADQVNWPLPDYRYGGIVFDLEFVHTGIDIPAKRGTTVIAAGKGKVIWADYGLFFGRGSKNDPYGLAVSIQHDFGYKGEKLYTIYAHLDRIDVEMGQEVVTGTPLGLVGLTGNTTGPHLHFEVRIEDDSFYKTRNPELWITPPQGWGVLTGDFRNTNGSFLDRQLVKIKSLSSGQKWEVFTYGLVTIHKDDYYQENMVISDLSAGEYEIEVEYFDEIYKCRVDIHPGAVSYIRFLGENGFEFTAPPDENNQNWPDPE